MLPVISCIALSSLAFGGEDPFLGRPWYHRDITAAAAAAAGWSRGATEDLSWQALNIDAYLYNPMKRLSRDAARRGALRDVRSTLVGLHFDDLFDAAAVERMWQRYTSGCVAAVLWCLHRGDVMAARHAIGLTLHALQDFYAHSSWLNFADRRRRTWWEVPAAVRAAEPLHTGSYEADEVPGVHPHGDIALSLPWSRSVPLGPPTALSSRLLARFVDLRPPGMSLDSRWLARSAVQVRGLTEVSGEELFMDALTLAQRTTEQWLRLLDETFGQAEPTRGFWEEVRSSGARPAERARPFDDASRQPARLIAGGPYPPPEQGPQASWFLHVAALPTGGTRVEPQLLGPYPELPPTVRTASAPPDTPVEVFAFCSSWPQRAGVVHDGPAPAGGDEVRLDLDPARLLEITEPVLAGESRS